MPINLEDKICHKNNTLCDGHNHIKQIWPLELNFWVVTNDIKEELQHFVAFGKIKTISYIFSFHITLQDQKIIYIMKIKKSKPTKTIWEIKLIFSSTIQLGNKEI